MVRLTKALVHLLIFAAGGAALANMNLFTWELPRGLLLPLIGLGFFVYLIAFLSTGAYRVFLPRSSRIE